MDTLHILILGISGILILLPGISPMVGAIAYVVIVNVNPSGEDVASATQVGYLNAIKTIVLPAVLLLKVRPLDLASLWSQRSFRLITYFGGFAVIGVLWSPLVLSALKLLGYFVSFALTTIFFYELARRNAHALPAISIRGTFLVIVLAFVFVVTGLVTTVAGEGRLSTGVNPQSFALFLSVMLVQTVSLVRNDSQLRTQAFFLIVLITLQLVMSGSRTGLLGLGAAFVGTVWLMRRSAWGFRGLIGLTTASVVVMLIASIPMLIRPSKLPSEIVARLEEQRAFQLITRMAVGGSLDEIETMAFRLAMYQTVTGQIASRPLAQHVIGNGTSSGGEVIAEGLISYRGFTRKTVDANRTVHNEFLRTFYEWGMIGTFLFLSFLWTLWKEVRSLYKKEHDERLYFLSISFVVIFLFLLVENVFASSGSPGGVAISFVLAMFWARGSGAKRTPDPPDVPTRDKPITNDTMDRRPQ